MLCYRTFALLVSLHATSVVAPNPVGWQTSSAAIGRHVSLHCSGNYPPGLDYLVDPNTNPNNDGLDGPYYSSLVTLCAHEDWGGQPRSAGGKCSSLTEDPYNILFDYRDRHYSYFITDVRLVLYCFTKCWCGRGSAGDGPPLARTPLTLPGETAYRRVDFSKYPARLDSITDTEAEPDDKFVTIIRIHGGAESGDGSAYSATRTRFTGKADGRVKCLGPVPNFGIPEPDGTFYDTLLELCAASIYGGNQRGSHGGICLSPSGLSSDSDYYHVDHFTHGSLLLTRASLAPNDQDIPTAAVRYYCSAHCYCDSSTEDIDPNHRERTIHTKVGDAHLILDDKSIHMEVGSKKYTLTETNLGQNRVELSTTGPGRKRPRPYEYHRVHTIYINPDLSEPPKRQQQQLQVADGQQQCPFDKDCKSSSDCGGCACHIDPAKSTVDPVTRQLVFLAGICADLISPVLAATLQSGYGRIGGRGLDGRAVSAAESREEDGAERIGTCACNVSYVSSRCCQAAGGLIWEEPEFQLGWLA